jgi:hypothetical protein
MAIKTISLELDAYEKLRQAKRGGESFSAVVRRARFDLEQKSGPNRVAESRCAYGAGPTAPEATPEYWDRIEAKAHKPVAIDSFDAATGRQRQRNLRWHKQRKGKDHAKGRGWTRDDLYSERLPKP